MDRYDIAIVGTGPAGLEAAITAKIRNKNILLIGLGKLSSKVVKAHEVNNFLGLPGISGKEMQEKFMNHLDLLNINITEDLVNTIYAMGDYFALQGNGEMYEADSVILACGMSVVKPLQGELENLGKGVSYCATCDGMLYRGKRVIVICYSKDEEKEAEYLAELADEVIYLPMYQGNVTLSDKVNVVNDLNPIAIEKNDKKMILKLNGENMSGKQMEADGIFILRDNVAPSQLVPGLEIKDNLVVVDRKMKTNLPGLFACGDITGAPYQYIKAAGEGNVAALSAVNYLCNRKVL